ncbi:MAG: Gfo/Idh/MocA family oxidoreductase [Anaerolineaceae bacterium]|jgi:predicted dehydrogenase
MMNKPVNYAVVGTGIGRFHAKGISEIPEKARLVAVCDINEAAARALAEEYQAESYTTSYAELIRRKDVDALSLCVPHDLHCEMAVAAARAGKHVLVEKPLAISILEANRVIAAAKENRVKLMTGHNMRYMGQHAKAKELVDQGVIGRPFLMVASVHVFGLVDGFRLSLKRQGGGTLIDSGVHRFDLIRWIMGDVKRLYGKKGRFFNMDMEGEDTAVVLMEFASGAVGTFTCSWSAKAPKNEEFLQIYGTKGSIITTYNGQSLEMRSETPPAGWQELSSFVFPFDQAGSIKLELADFADSILLDRQPPITGEDGKKSLELTLATYLSSDTGNPVDLPLVE